MWDDVFKKISDSIKGSKVRKVDQTKPPKEMSAQNARLSLANVVEDDNVRELLANKLAEEMEREGASDDEIHVAINRPRKVGFSDEERRRRELDAKYDAERKARSWQVLLDKELDAIDKVCGHLEGKKAGKSLVRMKNLLIQRAMERAVDRSLLPR